MTQLELANYLLENMKKENIVMNSGNCGMFAFALSKIMKEYDESYESLMIFFHEPKDIEETRELADREIMVYHIALAFDGLKTSKKNMEVFDADGVVKIDFIYNWIKEEYGQGKDYVSIHLGSENENECLFVIRNETCFKNNWTYFYDKMQNYINNFEPENKLSM
jgi:hypothetical protein